MKNIIEVIQESILSKTGTGSVFGPILDGGKWDVMWMSPEEYIHGLFKYMDEDKAEKFVNKNKKAIEHIRKWHGDDFVQKNVKITHKCIVVATLISKDEKELEKHLNECIKDDIEVKVDRIDIIDQQTLQDDVHRFKTKNGEYIRLRIVTDVSKSLDERFHGTSPECEFGFINADPNALLDRDTVKDVDGVPVKVGDRIAYVCDDYNHTPQSFVHVSRVAKVFTAKVELADPYSKSSPRFVKTNSFLILK